MPKQPKRIDYSDIEKIQILQGKIIYPLFGNKHILPYGQVLVTDGHKRKWVELKEDECNGSFNGNYITFYRKRYYVKNVGAYMSAKYVVDVEKTKQYRDDN